MGKIFRLPHFSLRSVIYLVQNIANGLADENGGKVPDHFLIEARLKQSLLENPERIDLDRYCRQIRKHWTKVSNHKINEQGRLTGGNLFVPGAFVTLGERQSGRMRDLDPITDITAWFNKDQEAREKFEKTMNDRRAYQLRMLDEGNRNRDCASLGELETKLRGYQPSAADLAPFTDDTDDEEDSSP